MDIKNQVNKVLDDIINDIYIFHHVTITIVPTPGVDRLKENAIMLNVEYIERMHTRSLHRPPRFKKRGSHLIVIVCHPIITITAGHGPVEFFFGFTSSS